MGAIAACAPEPAPTVASEEAARFIELGVIFAEQHAEEEARAAELRKAEREAGRGDTVGEPEVLHVVKVGDWYYLLPPHLSPERLDPGDADALRR